MINHLSFKGDNSYFILSDGFIDCCFSLSHLKRKEKKNKKIKPSTNDFIANSIEFSKQQTSVE